VGPAIAPIWIQSNARWDRPGIDLFASLDVD